MERIPESTTGERIRAELVRIAAHDPDGFPPAELAGFLGGDPSPDEMVSFLADRIVAHVDDAEATGSDRQAGLERSFVPPAD